MRYTIFTIIVLTILSAGNIATAQHFAVANEKMNVVYMGVPNPISVSAENCSCKELVVRSSSGTIKGANCDYVANVNVPGKLIISLYKKNGSKLKKLGEAYFRVKTIPSPVFKIGPNGRYMSKSVIAAQQYVRVELENFDFDAHFTLESFYTTIERDSSATTTIYNTTSKIGPDLHNAFLNLKIGDTITFDRIFVIGPDKSKRELEPEVIKVADKN